MKSSIQKRFENLTTRLISRNRGIPKYTFEPPAKPLAAERRGAQLSSYLKYAAQVERKL